MKIVDKYHEKILRLERDILLKPKVKTVNYRASSFMVPVTVYAYADTSLVHVLAGDLTTHKRTLTPIKSVIYGLRRYDLDRCIALENSIAGETVDKDKIVGYMSHKSKVYLVRRPCLNSGPAQA